MAETALNGNGTQTPRQMAAEEAAQAPVNRLNGALHPAKVEETLTEHLTYAYKPQLPIYGFRDEYWNGPEFYFDIEAMLQDDIIKTPLDNVKSALSHMQVQAKGSSTRVVQFLLDEWTKFKELYVPAVQHPGYSYGWMGAEPVYAVEQGKLVLDEFHDFAPRDVQPLVRDNSIVGVQVNNLSEGTASLPGSDKGYPAKGFWYAHRAVYGRHYGQSQIRSAWKPWRRVTGRDGLEEVMDIAIHRYGTGNVVVRAPIKDIKANNQPPGQTRQSTMERAREMAESIKAGGAIAMPSNFHPGTNTPEWDIDSFQPDMKLSELINGADYFEKKCSKAIGFPPELLEAAETGSGFSGRMIPLQGFLMAQQPAAQGIFYAWFKQIGEPLVRWNFGPNAWVKCNVVPLLKSYRQASQGAQQQPPQQQPPQAQGQPQPGAAQAMSEGMPAPQPDANGRVPYQGPRGGKGWRDPQGRVHYGSMMSTDSAAMGVAIQSLERGLGGDDAERNLDRLAKMLPNLEADELDALAAAIAETERPEFAEPSYGITADDVRRELGDALKPIREQITTLSTQRAESQPTVVNVTTPDVHFKAPDVHFTAPDIHIPQSEMRLPDAVLDTIETLKKSQLDMEQASLQSQEELRQVQLATKQSILQSHEELRQVQLATKQSMSKQSDSFVEAINRLRDQIAAMPAPVVNLPAPIVNIPETVVHVEPPIVKVEIVSGAMEIEPQYDDVGKVTRVIKTPIGKQEPIVTVTEGKVEVR